LEVNKAGEEDGEFVFKDGDEVSAETCDLLLAGCAVVDETKHESKRKQKTTFPIQVILLSKERKATYARLSDEYLIFGHNVSLQNLEPRMHGNNDLLLSYIFHNSPLATND